ncbi:MAG TPA: hypothetical protein VMB03_21005 [Bryobacteraceae bacterium]|nr:hypothetical protein [Bryobacteraceae bacterium]
MATPIQHEPLQYTRPSFPIQLRFSYTAEMYDQVIQNGTGETVEISSRQIRVRPITLSTWGAADFVMALDWPATLEDGTRLQLVLRARPIEPGPTITRLQIVKHEFRTRRTLERRMVVDLRLAASAAG